MKTQPRKNDVKNKKVSTECIYTQVSGDPLHLLITFCLPSSTVPIYFPDASFIRMLTIAQISFFHSLDDLATYLLSYKLPLTVEFSTFSAFIRNSHFNF